MSGILELFKEGGPIMYPLAGLSIATLACGLERGLFWTKFLVAESKIAHDVLAAARYSLTDAKTIAKRSSDLPIGRFLLSPLNLNRPTPDSFRLALETTAEVEFAKMRKGDSLLESTVGIAPLLGLLGTVGGLIKTFRELNIGGGGGVNVGAAAAGIGEALIATAFGMIVAILALSLLRVFVTLQTQQTEYFTEIGGDLELIYRQCWHEPAMEESARVAASGQGRLPDYQAPEYARPQPTHDATADRAMPQNIQPFPTA
jgi:biopolymer transport protein ExbB